MFIIHNMKNLILIFLSFVFFTSCKTGEELVSTETTKTKTDSTWTKTKTDTITIYRSVAGPTIIIPGPCDSLCDKNGKLKSFSQESKKNGIKSTVKTNTLTNTLEVDCNEDSLKISNEKLTIENNRLIREKELKKETVILPCEKEHRNWFDKLTRWWFWISLGITGGFTLFKFGPKLLKLFKFI